MKTTCIICIILSLILVALTLFLLHATRTYTKPICKPGSGTEFNIYYRLHLLDQIWMTEPDKFNRLIGKEIKDEAPINCIHITGIGTYKTMPLIEYTNSRGNWDQPLEGFNDNQLIQMLKIIKEDKEHARTD